MSSSHRPRRTGNIENESSEREARRDDAPSRKKRERTVAVRDHRSTKKYHREAERTTPGQGCESIRPVASDATAASPADSARVASPGESPSERSGGENAGRDAADIESEVRMRGREIGAWIDILRFADPMLGYIGVSPGIGKTGGPRWDVVDLDYKTVFEYAHGCQVSYAEGCHRGDCVFEIKPVLDFMEGLGLGSSEGHDHDEGETLLAITRSLVRVDARTRAEQVRFAYSPKPGGDTRELTVYCVSDCNPCGELLLPESRFVFSIPAPRFREAVGVPLKNGECVLFVPCTHSNGERLSLLVLIVEGCEATSPRLRSSCMLHRDGDAFKLPAKEQERVTPLCVMSTDVIEISHLAGSLTDDGTVEITVYRDLNDSGTGCIMAIQRDTAPKDDRGRSVSFARYVMASSDDACAAAIAACLSCT